MEEFFTGYDKFQEPKAVKVRPAKKAKKEPKAVKASRPKKAKKKKTRAKEVTNIDTVVGLIQGSTEGISTAELRKKTGSAESQILNIVNHAAQAGRVRKISRGVYGAA